MKTLIKNDVYNIASRIKKFDRNYYIVYDTSNKSYQIYSSDIKNNFEVISWVKLSYVLTLPYNQLDKRAINYLYETQVCNIEDIINQIDANNKAIENAQNQTSINNALQIAENQLRKLTR